VVVVGAAGRRAALVDEPAGAPYAVGRVAGVQDGAVGDLAGQPERFRAGRSHVHRGRGRRGPAERDVVEGHVPAGGGDPLAAQQRPHGGGVLAQERHRRPGPGADLCHPALHTVAEGQRDPAREQPVQRGGLHRGQRHVAQRHRKQADADPYPLGPGQGGGRGGDAALPEAVLPEPQLVEATLVGGAGHLAQPFGRRFRPVHNPENSH
jgi:hypothetical protein